MTNPLHQAPDSPEVGDVDTESLYGAAPDGSDEVPATDEPENPAPETPEAAPGEV